MMASSSLPDGSSSPLLIHSDPTTGRSYHSTRALPAHATVLCTDTPYAYTIWKKFRNEVCAECWHYEGGRRTFLQCRDEWDDLAEFNGTPIDDNASSGLWFCDRACRDAWLAREGAPTVRLLIRLEAARSKKEKKKIPAWTAHVPEQSLQATVTPEAVEQAWTDLRKKEKVFKETKKWQTMQLDDFETDTARYVLLALVHFHRESQRWAEINRALADAQAQEGSLDQASPSTKGLSFGGATWNQFASLQSNEQQHLQNSPEFLESHIRIYQALKGRLGAGGNNQSFRDMHRADDPDIRGTFHTRGNEERIRLDENICDEITVNNVRRALGVDLGNSFGVWEEPLNDESECLGFAVYPTPSFFNHHCAPNITREPKGRTLRFMTTRAVEANEELCISYGHSSELEWRARRKELRDGWFFDCGCSRCLTEMNQDGEVGSN